MAEQERHNNPPQTQEDLIGSRYALEVAFQTMKERCQKLQQRLAKVEDENTRLRLQSRKEKSCLTSNGSEEIETLRDTIAQLERQKQQLTHHVFMVTSENKQLWNRLTHSTKVNQSLGNQLSRISDTLNRYPAGSGMAQSQVVHGSPTIVKHHEILSQSVCAIPSTCKNTSPAQCDLGDLKLDSLEEISLKLINSFLQEKSELEDQCAQMAELRDGELSPTFSAAHLGLSVTCESVVASGDGEDIDAVSLSEVQQLRDSIVRVKQDLLLQQEKLMTAVSNLTSIRDGGIICKSCQERAQDATLRSSQAAAAVAAVPRAVHYESAITNEPESPTDSADEEVLQQLQNVGSLPGLSDRICPMCGRSYHSSLPFEEFHQHVISHFNDENLDSLQDNFVLVPTESQVLH